MSELSAGKSGEMLISPQRQDWEISGIKRRSRPSDRSALSAWVRRGSPVYATRARDWSAKREINDAHGNADAKIVSLVQSLSRWCSDTEEGSADLSVDNEFRLKSNNPTSESPKTARTEIRKNWTEEIFSK